MIKVLNVISDSNIGGAGRVLLNYLRYSDRENFRTMIALPRGSLLAEPLRELGGEVMTSFFLVRRRVTSAVFSMTKPSMSPKRMKSPTWKGRI